MSMKQLHIPGDWTAPIAFALVALGIFLRDIASSDQYDIPGGNMIAVVFLAVAALLSVAAVRGRSIQDSATYYYSDAKPTEFGSVSVGALTLFFGTFILSFALQEKDLKILIWAFIMDSCIFWFTYRSILSLQLVVFNTDKTFLTMKGKPWSLTRNYKVSDFQSLCMTADLYRGRYTQSRVIYSTYAVNGKKKVLLLRDGSIEKARETVKNISRLTGLKLVGGEPLGVPIA